MAIDYKTITKTIKNNPPTTYYPDPDNYDNYDDYADAYDDEKEFYMQNIAKILGYNTYDAMFNDLEGNTLDEAESDLFDFFYDTMVKEDYFDEDVYDDYERDDYDDYDSYGGGYNDYDY